MTVLQPPVWQWFWLMRITVNTPTVSSSIPNLKNRRNPSKMGGVPSARMCQRPFPHSFRPSGWFMLIRASRFRDPRNQRTTSLALWISPMTHTFTHQKRWFSIAMLDYQRVFSIQFQVINFWRVYYRFSSFGNIANVIFLSVLSFSKPQLNFKKIKMSRIPLSINLNSGCSSYNHINDTSNNHILHPSYRCSRKIYWLRLKWLVIVWETNGFWGWQHVDKQPDGSGHTKN